MSTEPQLRRNVIASYAGHIWAAAFNFGLAPVYIRLLGIESFGLIGFYSALLAALQLLDAGISPTMIREMARYSGDRERGQEARDLARTLESIYWVLAILIGVTLVPAASLIADQWLKAKELPPDVVRHSVELMGLAAALQWPLSLYAGGLAGLQRQVVWHSINSAIATVRGVGAVLILLFVSRDIVTFFMWQSLVSLLHTTATLWGFWATMPAGSRRARFDLRLTSGVRQFALGMAAIGFGHFVFVQIDKVVLSKVLPLSAFGYYSLAATAGTALQVFIGPLGGAVFPRLSSLIARDDPRETRRLFHVSSQLLSVIIIPVALMIMAFAPELLMIWSRSVEVVNNSATVTSILTVGTLLYGLSTIPYLLQLAHGTTATAVVAGLARLAVVLLLLLLLAPRYGAIGGALAWTAANAIYALIGSVVALYRWLPGELWRWSAEDVAVPFLCAAFVVFFGRRFVVVSPSPFAGAFTLALIGLLACMAATAAAPEVRRMVLARLRPAAAQ